MRRMVLAVIALALGCLAGCAVSPPGSAETAVITAVKHKLTVGGKQQLNPMPATAESIARGRRAFNSYCVACHGLDGQNTGVPFAEAMSPPVPPLNSPSVQSYTDGQLKTVITNGIRPSGMPAAKSILSDDEIWAIVVYLRHLPPKGSLGEPAIYSGGDPGAPRSPR